MTRWIWWTPARGRGRLLLGGLLIVVVLAAAASLTWLRLTGLPSDAALRVGGIGGTVVTRAELDRRVHMLDSLFGIRAPGDPAGEDRFRRESAQSIAVSTVLDRAAAQRGIVVSDDAARSQLSGMIDKQMGGRDAYVQLLGETGASDGDVLEEIKRQMRTSQLAQQVASPSAMQVTSADAEAYFRTHPAEMVAPEQRHLRNIVVSSQDEANDILRRVRGGEDFAAVATQSSLDQSTRNVGGDLGWLSRDRLEDPYAAAAFGAAPGAFVGPVQTKDGWNVGQVLEIHPAAPLGLPQVEPALLDRLRSERVLATWRGWMDNAIRTADVQYADDLRPADPTSAGPPTPGTPASPPTAAAPSASSTQIPPAGGARSQVSSGWATALALLLIGAAFLAIGEWGRRSLDDLVPAALPPEKRARKRRSLRRGAITSLAGGGVMIALALLGTVISVTG